MGGESASRDEIYRQIEEGIENDLNLPPDNFVIEVDDEEQVAIEGSVPSMRADEELERLLFDTLDLEDVQYDVVVDEDLQGQESPFVNEDPDGEYGYEAGEPDLKDLSSSPRRQF